jgi:hypothetical protein
MHNSIHEPSGKAKISPAWLVNLSQKVAEQACRRVGRSCSVCVDDVRQDLLQAAWTDPVLIPSLSASSDEAGARKVAYAFLDKTRKRLCREYRSKWPGIKQIMVPEKSS